ncbi:hypothetical protein DSM106972_007370 [Dulcicalothrix desertica PCC 7102]|uniref:Uncharacterized protein n=1 Tax=Dulcicalothrix desertica PCC 7102 TaxID=232991 RepID=A0A3S1AW70_9CYAN|nr:hypothetical protein [Dulcicalothrix desertica]RUT10242.1 hypothetical protein DSM106972_007370 [Dulcicalothrix desertica PCC 7102]TWH40782.1 hypothetical protein CAL7102_10137 [Dulcicalothrix desertica PCC 7102]
MKHSSLSVPNVTINVSIESSLNGEPNVDLSEDTMLLLKCLTLLNTLSTTAPEGLKEASEALESMVEFYKERVDNVQQSSLPQSLGVIKGNILRTVVRPPLVIDFE